MAYNKYANCLALGKNKEIVLLSLEDYTLKSFKVNVPIDVLSFNINCKYLVASGGSEKSIVHFWDLQSDGISCGKITLGNGELVKSLHFDSEDIVKAVLHVQNNQRKSLFFFPPSIQTSIVDNSFSLNDLLAFSFKKNLRNYAKKRYLHFSSESNGTFFSAKVSNKKNRDEAFAIVQEVLPVLSVDNTLDHDNNDETISEVNSVKRLHSQAFDNELND